MNMNLALQSLPLQDITNLKFTLNPNPITDLVGLPDYAAANYKFHPPKFNIS